MINVVLISAICVALMLTATALIFSGLQVQRLGREHSQRIWVAVLAMVYLVPALGIVASNRNLRAEVLMEDLAMSGNIISSLLNKAGYYTLLAICVVLILSRLLNAKRWPSISVEGRWLVGAMLSYVVGATTLSATMGTQPTFIPLYLGAPILFTATVFLALHPEVSVLRSLRNVLAILVLSSLITSVAMPAAALETYAIGLIPGFPLRFWGLTTHANVMGPLAALSILLCIAKPFDNRGLQVSALTAFTLAWLLAQSKTAWLALLAAIVAYGVVKNLERPQHQILRLTKVTLAIAGVTLLAIVMLNGELTLQDNSHGRVYGGGDFSGRTIIWEVALREWIKNPLFGYGPSIWSPEYRAQIGMNFAFHAHNQFYQTLSEAGSVGVALLATYLLAIAISVLRKGPIRPLGIAVFVFVMIRSMSEPTFRMTTALSGDAMIHFVLLCVAVTAIRNRSITNEVRS
jgi:O-antigen ligase